MRTNPIKPGHERLLQRRRNDLDTALSPLQQEPSDLLDEQRHATGARRDIIDDIARQCVTSGKFSHHFGSWARSSGARGDGAVMRPHAPGRANSARVVATI